MEKSTEVEKPFKCDSCTHRFSNEDHLQVHKKKHEMSLSFKGEVALGFVDETPTPTKSLQNSGLFDDFPLNPFDNCFLSEVQTPSGPNFRNQNSFNSGSLETPQICLPTPFVPLFPNHKSVNVPKTLNSLNIQESSEGPNDQVEPEKFENGATESNAKNVDQIEPIDRHNIFKRTKSVIERVGLPTKNKKSLKLHLSPGSSNNEESPVSESTKSSHNESSGNDVKKKKEESRKDLLARNRAAAVRSRQRKKQWVDGLERKCETLEFQLRETQAELKRAREENLNLRKKHLNCEISREELKCGMTIFPPLFETDVIEISPVVIASSNIPPTPQRGKRGRPANNSRQIPPIPSTTLSSTPKIPISPARNFKVQILTVPPQMLILEDDEESGGKTSQILTQNPK